MKKYKLGRALESVREDFRVGKHGAECSVYVHPLSNPSRCSNRRFPRSRPSYQTASPRATGNDCPSVTFAPVCNLFKAQCPLISSRYMLSLREIPSADVLLICLILRALEMEFLLTRNRYGFSKKGSF